MNRRIRLAIWSTLVTIVLIALPSMIYYGPKLVGKSFVDQEDFDYKLERTYEHLSTTVLNPIDLEELTKTLPVSQDEIEEHRGRYGSLSEQLDNIRRQYVDRITQAKEQKNEPLLLALVEERNTKIQDIEKNFKSDDYIADKIRREKAKELTHLVNGSAYDRQQALPISYDLVNIETGERLTRGKVDTSAFFKQEFDEVKGYFEANAVTIDQDEYTNDDYNTVRVFTEENDYTSLPPKYFEGTIIISKEAATSGVLARESRDFDRGKLTIYALWIVGVVAFAALLTIIKFRKEWVLHSRLASVYSHWKLDVKVALVMLTGGIFTIYIQSSIYRAFRQFSSMSLGSISESILSFLLIGVLFTALLAFQVVHLIELYREPGKLERAWNESYIIRFIQNIIGMFSNRTIGIQLFILLIGFFLAGIGLVGFVIGGFPLLIYGVCVLFLGIPALYIFTSRGAYLNRILAATNAMAAGQLTESIAVEGNSPLAKHAENLNNLREGVRISVNEQAKSERLKSELITNVSHDLRTPLTSIITYTDLLKDDSLSAEERTKYVAILDQKSQRLKILIEDLFEVSKMASGNMEIDRQRVDLNQLMQQALAEHAEAFAERELSVRSSLPEVPICAYVDGQKIWRVLDNLLVNTLKYSLTGTRVYVTLQKVGPYARITIKNVAKYEMGGNTDELFERFKRGDESRQTEGSGLGLAIAQSIIELHGGKMEVEVDGDLFKVTIDIIAG